MDDPLVGNLGKNLRAARKRLGLTQEEVAERSRCQAGEVSRIERGKRDPQVSTLEKLAAALEIPPGRLLDCAAARAIPPGEHRRSKEHRFPPSERAVGLPLLTICIGRKTSRMRNGTLCSTVYSIHFAR